MIRSLLPDAEEGVEGLLLAHLRGCKGTDEGRQVLLDPMLESKQSL